MANINPHKQPGLGQETGGGPDERRTEMKRLLEVIKGTGWFGMASPLCPSEVKFVDSLMHAAPSYIPSGRQIFWLRDIKDKLLLAD